MGTVVNLTCLSFQGDCVKTEKGIANKVGGDVGRPPPLIPQGLGFKRKRKIYV